MRDDKQENPQVPLSVDLAIENTQTIKTLQIKLPNTHKERLMSSR